MTNAEKYPNTADAVKAWNEYRATDNPDIGISDWLELDYIEPRPPSLLEAAKATRDWMRYSNNNDSVMGRIMYNKLCVAILAEEVRKKRNFERFATAEEAFDAFRKVCRVQWCKACRLKNKVIVRPWGCVPCTMRWLYSSDPNLLRNEGAERAGRAEEKSEEAGK